MGYSYRIHFVAFASRLTGSTGFSPLADNYIVRSWRSSRLYYCVAASLDPADGGFRKPSGSDQDYRYKTTAKDFKFEQVR